VIIGGSMETGSYLLVARIRRRDIFQYSARSGRTMSRTKHANNGMANNSSAISKRAASTSQHFLAGLAEEAGLPTGYR